MIKTLLLGLCLLAGLSFCRAQTPASGSAPPFSVSGTLKDTVNFTAAGYASISLIRSADSVLQTFTRADEEGRFVLKTDSAGTYLLLIAHPSFAIQVDELKIDKQKTDLGDIILTSKKQMLDEVVITDAKAIVIKGDTIEYNADSFQTRAYDNVDELLKKLPGIEVDRNGKIKAYGKEVQKMTVDGEEFFSDDPAVVAQTLRSSAVDKVQVFDKKSDQATFTGVDDGERTKTINLKLKEEAKKGHFGKVSGGAGLPGYWENQAMINSFKNKRKISAFGIMSNTNTNGLDWQDRSKYGGGGGSYYEEDDGFLTPENDMVGMNDSWNGQFDGQGLPRTWTGGGHYSNKWMGDSLSFNGNYRYGKSITEGFNNTRTQYILPDTQYVNTNNSNSTEFSQRHAVTAVTEYQLDTSSSLKLTLGGSYSLNNDESLNQSQSAASDGSLLNDISTLQQNKSENKAISASLFYRKRFRKKGRTISADFTGNWNNSLNNGSLNSAYTLFAIDSFYSINQRKQSTSNSLNGKLKVSYTEPLSKEINLEVNYAVGIRNSDAENSSFDRTTPGSGNEYTDVFNPAFSSHYVFNTLQNQAGANLRFNYKKFNFSFGGAVSDIRFRQEDLLYDTTYTYSYLNFFPRANFTFSKSQSTSFSFRYNGRTRQPTIAQIQPLRNNTDPLNIAIGNPDLKQETQHNFSLNYNTYKMLSSNNFSAYINFNVLQNAISQRQDIDISGRRTYQYINTNGNYNGWVYFGHGRKLIKDVYLRAGLSGNIYHALNYTNGLANENTRLSLNPSLSASYRKDTTLDLRYDFRPVYSSNTSSIRTDVKTKYWSFEQQFDGSINLPANFRLGTSVDWNIRQRLDPRDRNNNVFRWNAYLSRSFLKDKSLVAKVYVNDILDQNVGYNRYNAADYILESTYNTIRRYFLFSLTWNFTKSGAKKPADDVIIIGQ